MGMLQALEKEAQELLRAEAAEAEGEKSGDDKSSSVMTPIQNQVVLQQVDSMKEELVNLHETVAVQNAATSQVMAEVNKQFFT